MSWSSLGAVQANAYSEFNLQSIPDKYDLYDRHTVELVVSSLPVGTALTELRLSSAGAITRLASDGAVELRQVASVRAAITYKKPAFLGGGTRSINLGADTAYVPMSFASATYTGSVPEGAISTIRVYVEHITSDTALPDLSSLNLQLLGTLVPANAEDTDGGILYAAMPLGEFVEPTKKVHPKPKPPPPPPTREEREAEEAAVRCSSSFLGGGSDVCRERHSQTVLDSMSDSSTSQDTVCFKTEQNSVSIGNSGGNWLCMATGSSKPSSQAKTTILDPGQSLPFGS